MTTKAPTDTGHTIAVPASLIPSMFDEWGMDTITYVAVDGRRSNLHLSGYTYDNDEQIATLAWNTGHPGFHDITEDVNPDHDIRVWVPQIPEALAAELA